MPSAYAEMIVSIVKEEVQVHILLVFSPSVIATSLAVQISMPLRGAEDQVSHISPCLATSHSDIFSSEKLENVARGMLSRGSEWKRVWYAGSV